MLPGFLTVAWWAAKGAAVRALGASAKAVAAPYLSPWIAVPVVIAAAVLFGHVQINAAFKRGDAAGYERRSAEVAAATADMNAAIGGSNAASAAELAVRETQRAQLLADVKNLGAELDRTRQDAETKATALRSLNLENETLRRAKVRVIEKPVIKTRTVVRQVNTACGVGDTITAKLNQIN